MCLWQLFKEGTHQQIFTNLEHPFSNDHISGLEWTFSKIPKPRINSFNSYFCRFYFGMLRTKYTKMHHVHWNSNINSLLSLSVLFRSLCMLGMEDLLYLSFNTFQIFDHFIFFIFYFQASTLTDEQFSSLDVFPIILVLLQFFHNVQFLHEAHT